MKRIITIQDISCVGKCSLTVALPIISSMGIESAIIPTAVLSTHTAFSDFTFHDLTDEITGIWQHLKSCNLKFDAIYTGYLGNFRQIKSVMDLIDGLKGESTFVTVDPAMGDNGKLYKGFDEKFAHEMAKLCSKADLVLPNITEAAYLLNMNYISDRHDEKYIKKMLAGLCELGAKKAVITGVSLENGKMGVMGLDSGENEYFSYFHNKVNRVFHGTGDVFASTCVGALSNGLSLENSVKLAEDFTVNSILKTLNDKNMNWYGVNFEEEIPNLIKKLKELIIFE